MLLVAFVKQLASRSSSLAVVSTARGAGRSFASTPRRAYEERMPRLLRPRPIGFRDGLFVIERDWPIHQTLELYFEDIEQMIGFPLRDSNGNPLPDPRPLPLGKSMYDKRIKVGRFPATFEGQKTMAMIAFDPRWQSEERWISHDEPRKPPVWKDLATNGAPDAALRILADPSLFSCAPPTTPPPVTTLRILASRLDRWLLIALATPPATDSTANFDEIHLGVFRFVDAVLRFDVADPVVVLSAARLAVRLRDTERGKEALEKVARHVEKCAPHWAIEVSEGRRALKAGPAEWAVRELNQLPKALLPSSFWSAWDPLLGDVPVAFRRTRLLKYLDVLVARVHSEPSTQDNAPSTFPGSNVLRPSSNEALEQTLVDGLHEIATHARWAADDPVCRVLLLQIHRLAEEIPVVQQRLAALSVPHVHDLRLPPAAWLEEGGPTATSAHPADVQAAADRAAVILAHHLGDLLEVSDDDKGRWERAFPGVSSRAKEPLVRGAFYGSWDFCLNAFNDPSWAVYALINPSAVGLADVPVPSAVMASFLSSLSTDKILAPLYHIVPSNGAYAGEALLTGSLLDAVKQHGLGADPAVLLALQISLARALDSVTASMSSSVPSDSGELEFDELDRHEQAGTLRWALGSLGLHLRALAPTWPAHLDRSTNGRTIKALLAQVDEHRPLLDRLAGDDAMETWDLLGGRGSKFAQRSRLHAFLLRLRSHDPLTDADIISFVRPALVNPKCVSVSLLALAILDRTSPFGLSRTPPVSPAERKAAGEARADAWCSLVADMDCKSHGYNEDYECDILSKLEDIQQYTDDVWQALKDMNFGVVASTSTTEGFDWIEFIEPCH